MLPHLDEFTARAWEVVARQHVHRVMEGITAVGRWWGPVPTTGEGRRTEEREIDVVGVDAHRVPVVLGMCKWTNRPVGVDELRLLDRLAPYTSAGPDVHRFLFSRNGFDARLRDLADDDLTLVTPADIYA